MQREYILAKPARDAAAKAKKEAGASSKDTGPIHVDNEWDIRYDPCPGFGSPPPFHYAINRTRMHADRREKQTGGQPL